MRVAAVTLRVFFVVSLCMSPGSYLLPNLAAASDVGQSIQISADIEAEIAMIRSVWLSFRTAILAGDKEAALRHVNPAERARYRGVFTGTGSFFSEMPKFWSDLVPIEVGEEEAVFTFMQTEDGEEKIYSATFVKHPSLGWLVASF